MGLRGFPPDANLIESRCATRLRLVPSSLASTNVAGGTSEQGALKVF
jgi:hypothetical protein